MRETLHFAFEYLDRGWPVIPVIGKTPAVSWMTYQKRRPSYDDVKRWFGSGKDYNLAVITGSVSGLVVVDCDSVEAVAWWRENFDETPLVVQSGGGGTHFYYRYPAEGKIGNRARVFGCTIDVRGEGGIVVAPPSVHAQTREPYQWEPWDHYAAEEIPIFDATWLEPVDTPPLSARYDPGATRGIQDGIAYIRHIEAISGSGGHNATFRAACRLRDSGLTADEALEALLDWNRTNAKPPWTAKELLHKVEDVFRLF